MQSYLFAAKSFYNDHRLTGQAYQDRADEPKNDGYLGGEKKPQPNL